MGVSRRSTAYDEPLVRTPEKINGESTLLACVIFGINIPLALTGFVDDAYDSGSLNRVEAMAGIDVVEMIENNHDIE